ncbi:PAS domain-containing protein [Hymenobacter humi]|uniref:histidine kinase n=1 Tax=Hymenobacter humi TaxID=1411620 RepID=A0ABW2U1L5_9BACT
MGQAQARRAPGGAVLKWYGTNTDVHQQRVLQEQLLASQARFQQLLETLPQMTWTASPDGIATYFSQRWHDYTGVTPQGMEELGWEPFVHPDDLFTTMRNWKASLATGDAFADETRWRDQHGNYRWFLVRGEAIRDHTGAVSLWVGAHTDVHEFKQVQQQARSPEQTSGTHQRGPRQLRVHGLARPQAAHPQHGGHL